jgi:hypothetical protein
MTGHFSALVQALSITSGAGTALLFSSGFKIIM